MTPAQRIAIARMSLDGYAFLPDDALTPIMLHSLVAIAELLQAIDERQAAAAAAP